MGNYEHRKANSILHAVTLEMGNIRTARRLVQQYRDHLLLAIFSKVLTFSRLEKCLSAVSQGLDSLLPDNCAATTGLQR